MKKSTLKSRPQILEILLKQIDLLEGLKEPDSQILETLLSNLELVLLNPESMYITIDLFAKEFVSKICQKKQELIKKIEAIKSPKIENCDDFVGTGFEENIHLALLVNTALSTNAISLEDLRKKFSTSAKEMTLKNVQKVIMKAIQLDLIKATIDRKSERVFFKLFKNGD